MEERKLNNHKENKKSPEVSKEEKTVSLKEPEYLKLKEDADKARDYWDRLLRLQADFDNYRKNFEKEKEKIIELANENLIKELLIIVDDFERALQLI